MKIKFTDTTTGDNVYERTLLPSQEEFWKSEERFVLLSGGVGCGKSMIGLLRVIYECMSQPDNYVLVGRATYQEIHDVLLKEFFEICPDSWIKEYRKTPHPSVILQTFTPNKTSEIIFRNLDKMAQSELLGLNLGGFFIDQVEDTPEEVFKTLRGRLRRANIRHFGYMTQNPKLCWTYKEFKQDPKPGYKLIEASTLENEENLPAEYIADLKNAPEGWYRQYVLGIWDESLLSDNIVFAREHIEKLMKTVHAPKTEKEGVKIYHEYEEGHQYQIGVDCAEGADSEGSHKDNGVIVVWDKTTDTEVAHFAAKVPPRVLAEKAYQIGSWYKFPELLPEMNSMGLALVDKLEDLNYPRIYRRKEFDRSTRKTMQKLGWRTTSSSKQLLISYFEELLRKRSPKIHTAETVEELKTFVFSDNAKKKGAGAMYGFHDDRVMATLMAAFDENPVLDKSVIRTARGIIDNIGGDTIVPEATAVPQSVIIKHGKWRLKKEPNVATWS